MIAPVFHPNFDDASVCIGDFWAASEGIDDLVIRIGRMIAYQEYNTRSPLNGLAAKWAAENAQLLPIAPPNQDTQSSEIPSTVEQAPVQIPTQAAEGPNPSLPVDPIDPWSAKITVLP